MRVAELKRVAVPCPRVIALCPLPADLSIATGSPSGRAQNSWPLRGMPLSGLWPRSPPGIDRPLQYRAEQYMVEGADRPYRLLINHAFVLIQKHGRQSSARYVKLACCNDIAHRLLSHHLRKNLEIGDPQRPMRFKGGHDLRPGGFEPLDQHHMLLEPPCSAPSADPRPTRRMRPARLPSAELPSKRSDTRWRPGLPPAAVAMSRAVVRLYPFSKRHFLAARSKASRLLIKIFTNRWNICTRQYGVSSECISFVLIPN